MITFSFRYEDRLEGPSNFVRWKCWAQILLEEHVLWDFMETKVAEPIDPVQLAEYKKDVQGKVSHPRLGEG
jgi:hypothetical protein